MAKVLNMGSNAVLNTFDIEGRPADTRVVVAMSGGVDSSVTAALLAAAGYDVVGVTLQLYDHGAATHRKGACCAGRDIHDARAVAERIGIPHYVLDYEDRFKEAVIDRFAASYVAGETPVPCVECNQSIKFRDLLATARELGAAVLATGHYVASRVLPGGGRALYRAREAERDQSYFLFATTPAQLELLRFPLGDRTKAETRELARRFGLAVADKQDSQDICFVPSGHYADLIARLRPGAAGPGEIVSVAGLAEVTIGETLADPDRPVALPAITVDEPSLAMTIGINTSPLSGADGTKLTARLLKARARLAKLQQQVAAGTFVNRVVILAKAKKAVGRTHDLQGIFTFALRRSDDGQQLQIAESATAIQDERDLQGVYLLRTTVADLAADDLWHMYMLLTRVEAAFRNLKTDLCIRPIYHHKENRGDAHVLFSVLAYALSVTIQLRCRQHGSELTTSALLEALQSVQLAELSYQTSDGSRLCFERASVPSAAQQVILEALRWKIPDRYLPPNLEAEPRRVV